MSSSSPRFSSSLTSPARPKRKRMSADMSNPQLPIEDQATSRDASAEETADPEEGHSAAYDETFKPPPKPLNEGLLPNPPVKRARRSSRNSKPKVDGDNTALSSTSSESEDFENGEKQMRDAMQLENGGKTPPMAPPEIKSLVPKGYSMNEPPKDRPVRVYADGVFDLFHLGHMRALEQAKKALPNTYLLVGIPNDFETHKRKGLTVLSDKERAESLRHCKWVDEVIENAPWIVTPEFLESHNIDFVAHDDEPYAGTDGVDDIYKPCKEAGKFLVTQRTEGISTTYIITKIVRDYEKYISRQLKRGTSRQELNVSWLKKNELDVKRHVNDLRDSIKTNWSTTGRELRNEIQAFWAGTASARPSRPASPAFGRSTSDDRLAPGDHNTPQRSVSNPNLRALMPLDTPARPASPGLGNDFAAGYTLGLIGGVKSWMMRGRTASAMGSPRPSASEASSSDDESMHSPSAESSKKPDPMDTKV